MSLTNIDQTDSASIQVLSVKTLTVGEVTSSIIGGIVSHGIISSGEPTGSTEGELRAYQQGINLYVSLKSDGGIAKSGLFRSFSGFFNYYDLSTGDTNLDTVFPGASIILRISGNERLRINSSGNTQLTGSLQVTNGVTASLMGTASRAISASYAPGSPSVSASYAISASDWINAPVIKTGIVSGSAFSGNPKVVDVTFSTPMPHTLYTVVVTGEISRTWYIQLKTVNGFRINANNNGAFTNFVYWTAMTRGEY